METWHTLICTTLTLAPSVWCKGIEIALESASEDSFVIQSIEGMVQRHGCVSAGGAQETTS